jgi:hypothetical protein
MSAVWLIVLALLTTNLEWFTTAAATNEKEMQAFIESKSASKSDVTVAPDTVLKALSQNAMLGLKEESDAVSAALTANPGNPDLHEEAALIWWCFSERDLSGMFKDDDFARARIRAHMDVARRLRGDGQPGICGQLVEEALKPSVAGAEQLLRNASTPLEKSWARTMMIIASNDSTKIDKDNFTPIEEYESVRRMAWKRGPESAARYFMTQHVKPNIQWLRVVNNYNVSASLGQIFTVPFFRAEMIDFAHDAQLWGKRTATDWPTISPDLNLEPTTHAVVGDHMAVLSYADIAAWHQRQLLHGFHCVYAMYHRKLQMKDAAADLLKLGRDKMASLRLYPFIECTMDTGDKVWETYVPKASALVNDAPYLVPKGVWIEATRYKACAPLLKPSLVWFGFPVSENPKPIVPDTSP